MSWQVVLLPEAQDDFNKLDNSVKPEITSGLQKVSRNPGYPDGYGKPLGNVGGTSLAGLYKIKFKKSGIRVVYKLVQQKTEMLIIIIVARADDLVYREVEKRRQKHKI